MAKRYEKYKDSGLAWIGEIPDSWDVRKLKFVFTFGKGLSITKDNLTEFGVSVISYGQIHSKENHGTGIIDTLRRYVDADYLTTNKQSLVGNNDFIFADTSEDLEGVGNCVFVDNDDILFAGYHTIILKAKDIQYNKYLAYLFLSDYWRNQIRSRVTGVKVYSITKTILNGNTVLLPSATEQEQIAKYLDWKCVEIDRIVGVRKRQIKLLGELRTSVISRAVTRGLDPYAPLKNSGIDWIGHIPEHWEVKDLKHNFKYTVGFTPDTTKAEYYGGDIDWITIADMNEKYVKESNSKITQVAVEKSGKPIVKKGSLLYSFKLSVGKVAFADKNIYTNEAIFALRPNRKNDLRYFYYSLPLTMIHNANENIYGAPILNQELIQNSAIYCPPLLEQQKIADYLDKKMGEIDNTIDKFKAQIDKLKEYRQALITEVVTGKVDVRGIEIPAPKSN